MPRWGPIDRRTLLWGLRKLGFEGPFSGGKHQFMVRSEIVVTVPNPHRGDIGVGVLARVLKQAGVSKEEWEAV